MKTLPDFLLSALGLSAALFLLTAVLNSGPNLIDGEGFLVDAGFLSEALGVLFLGVVITGYNKIFGEKKYSCKPESSVY